MTLRKRAWLLAVTVMVLAVLLWTPATSRRSESLPYDWPPAADVDDGGCRCLRLESASGVMTEAARERMWAAYRLSDAHAAPDATQLSTRGPLRDRDALMKPVLAELRRSIRAFRRDRVTAAADAAELLRRAVGDVWVLVFDNRVYVAEGFVNHVKREGHATMAKAAADLVGLPNALYAVSTATSGANGCGEGEPLRLAVNKQVGYDQCGVLIPNTYFGKGNLTEWARECTATAPPFGARRPVALYRGSLHLRNQTEDQNTCARAEYGNYARLASFAASLEAPDRVDSKRTGQHPDPAKALAPPPVCAAFAPATGLKPGTPIHGAYLGDEEYRRHKYLLNLPGALKGSYSRNLNKLWRDGSVVLQWVAPYVEFYYPALRDRVTHVAVGRRSVADTVRALEANPAAAAAIGAAGKEIHDVPLPVPRRLPQGDAGGAARPFGPGPRPRRSSRRLGLLPRTCPLRPRRRGRRLCRRRRQEVLSHAGPRPRRPGAPVPRRRARAERRLGPRPRVGPAAAEAGSCVMCIC